MTDFIFLEGLTLSAAVGTSGFGFSEKRFPVVLSLRVAVKPIAEGIDVFRISYGDVCRSVTSLVEARSFDTLPSMLLAIQQLLGHDLIWIEIRKEGGILRVDYETIEYSVDNECYFKCSIMGIKIGCIIGIYDHEKMNKQDVIVDISYQARHANLLLNISKEEQDKRAMVAMVCAHIEESKYETVEALADSVSQIVLDTIRYADTTIIKVSKPSALNFAKQAGVCITRQR